MILSLLGSFIQELPVSSPALGDFAGLLSR